MNEANIVNVTPDPNKDPIRRLTNWELWHRLLNGTLSEFGPNQVQQEIERRLRKVAFLPALPPKEDE